MIKLFKDICKPAYQFVTSNYYREYYRLFSKYGKKEKYHKASVRFLDYSIEVPDVLSFIHQYKEIFVDQSYHFKTHKPNPVIYDCGANIGLSCLFFKRIYPNCILKGFEADPNIFDLLTLNLSKNLDDGSIELSNKAVWIHNNGVEFSTDGSDAGTLVPNRPGHNVMVESLRLKDLIKSEKIDFLKMDIEGAEADVLIDCGSALRNTERIFFEYHSFLNEPQRLNEILNVLTLNDFRYFIQSPYLYSAPFDIKFKTMQMDLQLNVYCYKKGSS